MKADWVNSYAALPDALYVRQTPTPVSNAAPLVLNDALAAELGIGFDNDWVEFIAGNKVSNGADPITQAYSGHQFGHWNPKLGDGRAVLLGDVQTEAGLIDIQLKGSGHTPWSRGGDGRAWVGPVLREYLVSEAMHALGIPTTRALGAALTGEMILRDPGPLPGAVIARTASSHIRVGTFQYFAARDDHDSLNALFQYASDRHYPDCTTPADFLTAAVRAQAELVAKWMSVGFIHGVMNTDNSHVGGLTIDYGPCAFMDAFHPMQVFSSIDRQGRYAYGNQPNIAAWNMAQLATALLPLTDDRDQAITQFTEIVHGYSDQFETYYRGEFCQKLGLDNDPSSDGLIDRFMAIMARQSADFTQSFYAVSSDDVAAHLGKDDDFVDWDAAWRDVSVMTRDANPAIIPRNHVIEQVIDAAVRGDMAPFHDLNLALQTPYEFPSRRAFFDAPKSDEIVQATFCGT